MNVQTHNYKNIKDGFSLAEALITLMLAGVIASIILPSLIIKVRNKLLENQFKKANSTVSQAIKLMNNDLDNSSINDKYCTGDQSAFIEDFAKYFIESKVKKSSSHIEDMGYKKAFFLTANKIEASRSLDNFGGMKTNTGMIIYASGCSVNAITSKMSFIIDTNGTKEPNRFGYDVFFYTVDQNNILNSPVEFYNKDETSLKKYCNFLNGDNLNTNGLSCANWAIRDVFPHDNAKSYWGSLP